MNNRIPVSILAATGAVGQRFVQLLDGHPFFEVTALTGSDKRAGRRYGEACDWILTEPLPKWAADMTIQPSKPETAGSSIVFSALPKKYAYDIEPVYAAAGAALFTNAGAFRPDPLVPVLLPEINSGHLSILQAQREKFGWPGFIVCNSNCTSTGISIVLKVLDEAFGVEKVMATSLQAISGAGYPGVASLDMVDNILPYIAGEEEKVEWEPRKINGTPGPGGIEPHPMRMSVHANRVPVSDGHTVCMSLGFGQPADSEAVANALREYKLPAGAGGLPSSPEPLFKLPDQPNRPQPRLDRMNGRGMSTTVGRIRPDPLLDVKMVVLSHNTIRGAAGGSIYNAEFMLKSGLLSI